MKKHLLFLAVACFCLFFVVMLFYFSAWKNNSKLQGALVFANTYNDGLVLDKIKIITADDVIELIYKDKYWMINSSTKYYADFSKIHKLLTFFNNSVYMVKMPLTEGDVQNNFLNNPLTDKENSGMLIQTYADEKLLDEIILGRKNVDDKYFFAKNFKDKYIWITDNYFEIPVDVKGWLPAPVFSVEPSSMEYVAIDEKKVQRKRGEKIFSDQNGKKIVADPLLNVFSNIFIYDVADKDNFEKIAEIELKRKVELISYDGLKIEAEVFVLKNKEVWINIKLLTTLLPKTMVKDYIKDNSFLYNGKYFKISSEQGHILRYFRLF